MDEVVLRRNGISLGRERPLRFAGGCLGFLGTVALSLMAMGWPPPAPVWVCVVAVPAVALFPWKALAADRASITVGAGPGGEELDWDTVTRVMVDEWPGAVIVGVRTRPDGASSVRPDDQPNRFLRTLRVGRTLGDRPFALSAEVTLGGRSAAYVAERIGWVAPVPVAWAGEARPSYRVRAPRRSVLPFAVLAIAWIGGVGTGMVLSVLHDHPGALLPLVLVGAGALLTIADLLVPRWILVGSGAGLYIDGEFLAGDEIEAVEVVTVREGTELRIRFTPGTPAAEVAPAVHRTLRHVRLDPARLAAGLPSAVRVDATG